MSNDDKERLLYFDWTTRYIPLNERGQVIDREADYKRGIRQKEVDYIAQRLINGKWVTVK